MRLPPVALGATTCLYDAEENPTAGWTFTHPPNVRGFDYIPGVPDVQMAWFRNRYYFKNTAGGWTETFPSSLYPESTQWYWNLVTEAGNVRSFWTMENNRGLDFLGMEKQLRADWNLGFNIVVAQEIVWWRPETTDIRDRDVPRFGPHHWNVAVNVTPAESCAF